MDIAYQYLSFFEEDDAKMEKLASEYRKGTLSTREMKAACIEKLQEVVAEFQKVCLFFHFLLFLPYWEVPSVPWLNSFSL